MTEPDPHAKPGATDDARLLVVEDIAAGYGEKLVLERGKLGQIYHLSPDRGVEA